MLPSVAAITRSGTNVVLELNEAPLAMLDMVDAKDESPILDASAPAAAII